MNKFTQFFLIPVFFKKVKKWQVYFRVIRRNLEQLASIDS